MRRPPTWAQYRNVPRIEEVPVAETRTTTEAASVRPFRVNVPDEAIEDMRRRVAATRWPSRELVADRSQGVQLATMQELTRYWTSEYDWRRCEARLNALPQFRTEIDGDSSRTARAWAELMHRLGYTRYVAQGGDVGALVTDLMGRQAVEGLVGYHLNLLTAVLAIGDQLPKESEQERAAAEALATFREDGFGYFLEMATRPQTIGYALLDSPVALAAWMLDHDTDSYYKISRAFVDGKPVGNLTRDSILNNITLYWLTGTAASAARSYWEDARALAAALASGQPPPAVKVPVGFTTFPGEIWASPRSWVEAVYPGIAYFNEVDRGGHFAAWEEPELFSQEMREAFASHR